MSGILQQGYAAGYVFAACANLGVGGSVDSWKTIFKIGGIPPSKHSHMIPTLIIEFLAGLSFGVAGLRACFPESQQFLEAKAQGRQGSVPFREFYRSVTSMFREQWRICVYCIILMTGFNYLSHTSQDSYTTFMLVQKKMDNKSASIASILMQTGAFFGGTLMGYLSQFIGRRRSIIVAAFLAGCLIPAWILPTGAATLSATGFLIQFFVQGAWGAIPIHLNELSPPAFRSLFPGICYQLGNMISSPSAQIVNTVAERTLIHNSSGELVEAYGPAMGVSTAIVLVFIIITTAVGPENRGRAFEHAVAGIPELEGSTNAGCDKDEEMGTMSTVESRVENVNENGQPTRVREQVSKT